MANNAWLMKLICRMFKFKNNKIKAFFSSLCTLLMLSSFAHADHGLIEGTPLIKRYLAQDYLSNSAHNAIMTDESGRIYVGNSEGLLVFDGTQWELAEIPRRPAIRDVIKASDGKIYLAAVGSFGILNKNTNGQWIYQDLLKESKLDTKKHNIGVVWLALEANNGVYFQTDNFLFYVSFDRKTQKHWPITRNVRHLFEHKNKLYSRIDKVGFSRFENGKFFLEKDGEQFSNNPIAEILNKGDWRLIISDGGFFRSDDAGIKELPSADAKVLQGLDSYDALLMSDQSIVIGTGSGEVLRFDKALKLQQRIKIGNFPVIELTKDLEGGVWAVTEGDIVRINIPSPWSYYNETQGVHGAVYDFEWHRDALWLAGSVGVSRINRTHHAGMQTEKMPWVPYEALALKKIEEDLLIAHREGLLVLDAGTELPRYLETPDNEPVFELLHSKFNKDLVYALGDYNLFVLSNRSGRWQILRRYPLEGINPFRLMELAKGELWIGNRSKQQARWLLDTNSLDIKRKETIVIAKASEQDSAYVQTMYSVDDQVYIVSSDKNYRFDGKQFIPDDSEPFKLLTRPYELRVEENEQGRFAYTTREILHQAKNQKAWKILRSGLSNTAGYNNVKLNHDGVLRIATWAGVLQYLPHAEKITKKPYVLGFEYVTAVAVDDKKTISLPLDTSKKNAQVPAGHNLKLRFQLINLESGVDFRYRLSQISTEWSEWGDHNLFIRTLPPGDYLFELEAKTRGGEMVSPVAYKFTVLPYWYQRLWVQVLAGILLLTLIGFISNILIRACVARYRSDNERLEGKISERTQELKIANQRLSELAIEDELTGVANRRALEQGLQREWYRCQDLNLCLSAMMIDVDHFKQYNDKYGHLEGDKLLREIAQSLQFEHDSQRELFARFGGEEFALLLPGIGLEETLRRAELIRNKISKFPNKITVSIGVAGFVPTVHLEKNSLLRKADAALYRAKRQGRNRVEADSE
jgi:diguanylate cyclase (GGDEF)-like protein